jgi:hypothetical protein
MKKLILILSIIGAAHFAIAQCTPDPTLTYPGIKPAKLPDGIVGTAYSETVSLMVPQDTNLIYNGTPVTVRVDSARVIYISMLPHNFSYVTDKPSQTWGGGKKGCAVISGMPDVIGIGKYAITVKTQTWFKVIGLSNTFDQIDSSSIDFEIRNANSVKEIAKAKSLKVYPNPAKEELIIELNQYDAKAYFEVYNILGSKLDVSYNLNSHTGMAKLNISELPNGVYFVRGKLNGNNYQAKFIKE